jgi:hypothetical protein
MRIITPKPGRDRNYSYPPFGAEEEAILAKNAELSRARAVVGPPGRRLSPVAEAIGRLGGVYSARAKRSAS